MNAALLATAQGDWKLAADTLKELLELDAENYVVCLVVLKCFVRRLMQD